MGQGSSRVKLYNEQEVSNRIVQISESNCITTILNTNEIKVEIINSVIKGDVIIERTQLMNGISCSLKTILSNELINSQKSEQQGSIDESVEDDTAGIGSLLSNLTPWGAAVNFAEATRDLELDIVNIQRIVNEVTQQINAMCQNRVANENGPINELIQDSTIYGNVKISEEQKISNTSCVIENGIRNQIRNDQEASQEGVIDRSKQFSFLALLGPILFLILIIAIGAVLLGHGIPGFGGGSSRRR